MHYTEHKLTCDHENDPALFIASALLMLERWEIVTIMYIY